MLAHGVPLLLAGDEAGNSQSGNNNAYCQDNPTGWVDWSALGDPGEDMTDLVATLTDLRRRFSQLRQRRWVDGRRTDGSIGVLWLTPKGTEMTEQDWKFPEGRFLSYVLGAGEPDSAPLYIALNAAAEEIALTLPALAEDREWTLRLDTAASSRNGMRLPAGATTPAAPRSVLIFAGEA